MLPVYCEVKVIYANEMKGRKEDKEILITELRKAEGNLFQLRKDGTYYKSYVTSLL